MRTNGQHGTTEALPTQYDHRAERAVLGSILIDPPAIYQVADFLSDRDFHHVVHRDTYLAMLELTGERRAIDPVTVINRLQDKTPPKDGWEYYILDLLKEMPTSYHIHEYARIVEGWAVRRRLLQAAQKIAKLAHEDGSLDAQLGQAETAIFNVRQGRATGQIATPHDYVNKFLSRLDERQSGGTSAGICTGFYDLDRLLEGMQPGMPYILAARPGMGKSALAINIAANLVLREGKQVLFFTPEMTQGQIVDRIISGECEIPTRALRSGRLSDGQLSRIYAASGKLSESNLFIDDTPGITPGQIRARSMRHYAEHGLDLIIVDHLHEMQPDNPKAARHLELGDMARALKETAKLIGCPMLIVAQLSRALEARGEKRPILPDLRESGALEEVAYAVMFLYREHYHDETAQPGTAEVEIAKHRDGETGRAYFHWQPEYTRYKNGTQPERIAP